MKKNKRNGIRHIMAMILFCMVLSVGMVSLADVQGTVIAKSAVIRAAADPNSEKLASVPSGKTIDIISKTSGTDNNTWYQVYVNSDTKGYIRSDLIKVSDGANIPTTQGGAAASSTDASATTATPVEARQVTVISNNTNIREAASTESASRAKANRGMVLTVVGEATGTDGKKWYQVSFTYNNEEKTGFIRSDLVTTDNVSNDPATSQITGEENPGEEQPAETTPSEEQPPEQPAETPQADNNSVIPMNVDEVPYIMPGFELITLSADGEGYNAYKNGAFLIFYGQKQNGEQGWFLFDAENHIYQRYVYTTEGVTPPEGGIGSVGLIPVIVLVVIIVILVAIVGLLLIKIKGQGNSYKRYKGYDDDDDQDDDIEDLEDLEDDDDEPQPVRRPQGPQPVRRPQPVSSGNASQGQPPRRPQGQQPPRHPQSQQPPRRQQANPSNGNAQQGGQPPRRQQGGQPANNGGARPQGGQPPRRPQGNAQGQPSRRPQQPQNERVPGEKGQVQKGYKAKNLLEDDDMDFMDIE